MKIKLNFNFELKIHKKSKNKKKKNNFSLRKPIKWVALEILSILLEKLVTWIIRIIMNRPFYFYNSFFLSERKVVF